MNIYTYFVSTTAECLGRSEPIAARVLATKVMGDFTNADILGEMRLESTCGAECKRVIDGMVNNIQIVKDCFGGDRPAYIEQLLTIGCSCLCVCIRG